MSGALPEMLRKQGRLCAALGSPMYGELLDRLAADVEAGGVFAEVLAEADACHADLIVTGSHWPTLATYLIGSHATSIARHAHCSVLVVRGEGL